MRLSFARQSDGHWPDLHPSTGSLHRPEKVRANANEIRWRENPALRCLPAQVEIKKQ